MPKEKQELNSFEVTFLIYNLTYVFYMVGYIPQIINFASLVFCLGYNLLIIGKRHDFKIGRTWFFWNEYKSSLFIVGSFTVITLFIQAINLSFNFKSFLATLLYFVVPPIIALTFANSSKEPSLYKCMLIMLLRCVLYFLLKNRGLLSLANILTISWSDTKSSVFEMVIAHDFLFLEIIFLYLKKPKTAIVSMLFCMLCFKRVSFLLAVIVLSAYYLNKFARKTGSNLYVDMEKKTTLGTQRFVLVGMIFSTFIMNYLYSDKGISMMRNFGIDLAEVTTGRVNIVNYVKNSIGRFNGLGSISFYLKHNDIAKYQVLANMHCDVLGLLYEVTIVGSIIFFATTLKIGRKNRYSFILLMYIFVEMVVSHMLDSLNIWMIFYIFVAYLSVRERNMYEEANYERKKHGRDNNSIL